MNLQNLVQTFAVIALPVLFAITLHVAARGYTAHYFGDRTAKSEGRLTLNPAKHIDPLGTIVVPLVLYFTTQGSFMFGYGRALNVDPSSLRRPRQDLAWVELSGPAMNLVMALLWGVMFVLLTPAGVTEPFFRRMASAGVMVNLAMWAFTLFPLPPMPGGRVLMLMLPWRYGQWLARVEPWGFFIVMGLAILGVVGTLWLRPLMAAGAMFLNLLLSPLAALI